MAEPREPSLYMSKNGCTGILPGGLGLRTLRLGDMAPKSIQEIPYGRRATLHHGIRGSSVSLVSAMQHAITATKMPQRLDRYNVVSETDLAEASRRIEEGRNAQFDAQSANELQLHSVSDSIKTGGSGGTGRRARLRILWGNTRGGSSPLSRTKSCGLACAQRVYPRASGNRRQAAGP